MSPFRMLDVNVPSLLVASLPVVCLLGGRPAMAQKESPRLELGVLLPVLSLSEHEGTDIGFGGRLTCNLTQHLALEGELNLFPRELTRTTRLPTVPMLTDRRIQALFGVKAGTRWEDFGLFVKAKPGLVNFHNELEVVCVTFPCPPLSSSQTELAFDLGGAIELYLSRRVAFRADVGDLWIRGTGNDILDEDHFAATGKLGHNFQWTTGVSFRF